MIIATRSQMSAITDLAEASYPAECCGLLAGSDAANSDMPGSDKADTDIRITRVVPSDNVSQTDTRDSFEVDPKVRFDLMRALDGTDERIVGHYHSHPDHPAEPSDTDLSMIYEPELFWLIASTGREVPSEIKAYRPSPDATSFSPVPIRIIED